MIGLWGSLVWNMVTCQMALNHLETLQKWIAYAFFHEKNNSFLSQSKVIFVSFQKFHPCLSPQSMIWFVGSLVWNMVTCQNGFKSLETLQKWSRMPSFMKKNRFWASQNHFCKFSEFHPWFKSQSMIWFVGKSCVKYGNLSKWL